MAEITLEKLHSLLEGLAEHVMNNMPTKQEMNARFEQVDKVIGNIKTDVEIVKTDVEYVKADIEHIKTDISHIKGDMQYMKGDVLHMKGDSRQTKSDIATILNILDQQAKNIDIIRTEQTAISHVIDRHEKRITALEENETGYKIQDKKE